MKWLQRVWKFQTSEGHNAFSWRSYVQFKKCRKKSNKDDGGTKAVKKRAEKTSNTLTLQRAHAYADLGTIKPNNSDWGSSMRTNKEQT